MRFAIINKSKRITDDEAQKMADAVQIQMASHVALIWDRFPPKVEFFADESKIPEGAARMILFDAPDEPDALGYHTEGVNGEPFAKVFANPVLDNGGVVLFDPSNDQNTSVSSVLSHEAAELFCDPDINEWSEGTPTHYGSEYALEACDPCEATSYTIALPDGTNVSVSDFVTPLWFDVMAPLGSQMDYCKTIEHPFTIAPGGYCVIRSAPGTEQQVFGEKAPPAWRVQSRRRADSRASKRGVK